MLTNGKIKQARFTSFAELAKAVNAADAEKARNLARTKAMRDANAKRRAQRDAK